MAANKLKETRPEETGLSNINNIEICEVEENSEPEEFGNGKRKLHVKT